MKANFSLKKSEEKDFIKSVFRTLHIQAIVLSLITVVVLFHIMHLTGSYFSTMRGITYDLGEVIVKRFSEDVGEEQAIILADEYSVLIRYKDQNSHWIMESGIVTQLDEEDYPRRGMRHWYQLNEDAWVIITWESTFLTSAGHVRIFSLWGSSILIVIGSVIFLIRRTLLPLSWFQKGIEQLMQRNFQYVAPKSGRKQIDRLAERFNEMTSSIRELIKSKDQLVADVSHELRSPLTRIKLALELFPDDENVRKVKNNVITIEEIITSILEGQRINLQTMELEKTTFNLNSLVKDIINLNNNREPGIKEITASQEIEIHADRHLLKLLLHNLLDNALKYSLPDSQLVQVDIFRVEGGIIISITDDGVGVAEKDLEKIYQPFYKVAKERGFNSGYGLGLSLCKRIVDIHQWSISIKNHQPRGLEVNIKIDDR